MKNKFLKTKPCRKIVTFDSKTKKPKGWLLEIVSDQDKFTKHLRGQVYLTVINPGGSMDYHMHAGADYFVTCLKGKIREVIYKSRREKEAVEMGDDDFKTVFLPRGYPHAIENLGQEPAYVLVYRSPAWSPEVQEQCNIPQEQIETTAAWKTIKVFKKNFKKEHD